MAKELVKKPRRNGNGAKRPRKNGRTARASSSPPSVASAELAINRSGIGTTQLRFQLASVLRVADNLVNRAVAAYDSLFALEPREADEIYLAMGKELAREDRLEEALEAFRKVIAAKPDHGEALFESALIHLRRGAPHAALELFQRAKSAGSENPRLFLQLARVLGALSRHQEALGELDRAIDLAPKLADAHYQRAVVLDRLGRYPEAVESFEAAIGLAPTEVKFHQALGFTLETLGRRGDAIQCFKRALEFERNLDPVNDACEP